MLMQKSKLNNLDEWLSKLYSVGHLKLPKFTAESDINLKDIYPMDNAFDSYNAADFLKADINA